MGRQTPYHLNYVHRTQRLPVKIDWSLRPFDDRPPIDSDDEYDYDDEDEGGYHSQEEDEDNVEQPAETCAAFSSTARPLEGKCHVLENQEHEVGGSSNGERGGEQEQVVEEDEEDEDKDEDEEVVSVEEVGEGGDHVLTRMQELENDVHEHHLSQEHINLNDQLQVDELLAMESIYGDTVYRFEERQGLRVFQFHIDIDISGDYAVSTKLKTASGTDSKVDVSDEFSYTFNVQYLPPIVLTCLLPKSYPSHSPPLFTISVQWLHESKISKLCSMLDSLSNDQPGKEILYPWVDWLHCSALAYLGFGEELVLDPYAAEIMESGSDRRAISGRVNPDVDIMTLKSYNKERQHENFVTGLQECCICFSEYPGTEFLRLPCHHFFCVKCMKTYANVHVKDGTVHKLQCPETKCDGMVPPGLLKRLLGDEEFERWESMMLQKTLDAMPDIAYCPRCETACLEDEGEHAQCSKCFFNFCTLCRERRHVGEQCMTPEMKLKVLEERQSSSNLKEDQRMKVRELINELRSVAEILRECKQCPSCKTAISRSEGCNKMVCSNCGAFFCYRCNKQIDGYDHFRPGFCELFPEDTINAWEEQLNDRQRIGQYIAANFGDNRNAKPCPTCRQLNAKIENHNHIFCWSCQTNYCYQCGKIVRRFSQHYGANRCKQHSAD
ncbi:hypothetical protein vseg_020425 [Gypsophila vaccaria]